MQQDFSIVSNHNGSFRNTTLWQHFSFTRENQTRQPKTFNTDELKIPDPARKNRLVGESKTQKCYYLDISLAHGVDLSRCGLFSLELLRVFVGTTLLLEDNLPPLIRSPMWWHTLTPTICWNTSSSTQHSGASRQTTQSNQRGYWVALPRLEAGTRT